MSARVVVAADPKWPRRIMIANPTRFLASGTIGFSGSAVARAVERELRAGDVRHPNEVKTRGADCRRAAWERIAAVRSPRAGSGRLAPTGRPDFLEWPIARHEREGLHGSSLHTGKRRHIAAGTCCPSAPRSTSRAHGTGTIAFSVSHRTAPAIAQPRPSA